ncbi:MAG: hypothetical protein LBH98_08405 [Chitinispirillales bacterium]|jgi:hypothetical protein|nr:hypothetical protein [Chitinispirillales bacterium]
MHKNKINLILLLLAILILSIICQSCAGAGGRCKYITIDAYVIIDSITSLEDYCKDRCEGLLYYENCYNNCIDGFLVYFSMFNKSNNEKFDWIESGRSFLSFASADCISTNRLSISDTLSCKIIKLIEGTCSPISFEILDYSECFSEIWYY